MPRKSQEWFRYAGSHLAAACVLNVSPRRNEYPMAFITDCALSIEMMLKGLFIELNLDIDPKKHKLNISSSRLHECVPESLKEELSDIDQINEKISKILGTKIYPDAMNKYARNGLVDPGFQSSLMGNLIQVRTFCLKALEPRGMMKTVSELLAIPETGKSKLDVISSRSRVSETENPIWRRMSDDSIMHFRAARDLYKTHGKTLMFPNRASLSMICHCQYAAEMAMKTVIEASDKNCPDYIRLGHDPRALLGQCIRIGNRDGFPNDFLSCNDAVVFLEPFSGAGKYPDASSRKPEVINHETARQAINNTATILKASLLWMTRHRLGHDPLGEPSAISDNIEFHRRMPQPETPPANDKPKPDKGPTR